MLVPMKTDQTITLTATPRNDKGGVARVAGVPTWVLSDPALGVITPAADGLSAQFLSVADGLCQATISGNADLKGGTRIITGTIDLDIAPREAVAFEVTANTPQDL